MSKIRDLVVKGPQLCGLYDAERWAVLGGTAFDVELADPTGPGKRQEDETVSDRLRTVLAWRNYVEDVEMQRKGAYIQNLLVFTALSVDKNQGLPYDASTWENLWANLVEAEPTFPDVATVLTVAEASTMDYWN